MALSNDFGATQLGVAAALLDGPGEVGRGLGVLASVGWVEVGETTLVEIDVASGSDLRLVAWSSAVGGFQV